MTWDQKGNGDTSDIKWYSWESNQHISEYSEYVADHGEATTDRAEQQKTGSHQPHMSILREYIE